MRRNEITPELIELSKRAKELGFPQDVERSDWVIKKWKSGLHRISFVGNIKAFRQQNLDYALILSFSRCLEWLENKSKGEMIGLDPNNFIHGHWIMGIKTKTYRGKNIHEAGAKAVVMKLEENNA